MMQSVLVSISLIMSFKMVVYLVIVRPFVDQLSMLLSILNEGFLIVILGTTAKFLDPLLTSRVAQ